MITDTFVHEHLKNKVHELIEAAKLIYSANPMMMLSGSLALHLQDIQVRRRPKDIDIFLPYGVDFVPTDGMQQSKEYGDNGEYDDENWERRGYTLGDIKVDVFTPEEGHEVSFEPDYHYVHGFNMLNKFDIMKFKLQHSYGEAASRYKHSQDIIHMLVNM